MGVIVRGFERPSSDLVEGFRALSASTVHEALGKETGNAMDHQIKPIAPRMKVVGAALTVQCFPADNITVHRALALASPGDVLVVDGHGVPGAMWGAQFTYQAKVRKVAGIVVDGSVRDVAEIAEMGFPCFARMITTMGSAKDTPGSINIPIQCGGVIVNPGDIVLGDDDGVVVIPRGKGGEVLSKARERERRERDMRKQYEEGKTSFEIYGFEKVFQAKGVKEV